MVKLCPATKNGCVARGTFKFPLLGWTAAQGMLTGLVNSGSQELGHPFCWCPRGFASLRLGRAAVQRSPTAARQVYMMMRR